ncbi:MAG: SAM-dependent methyltransferase [Chitinophagaceae bacterium]|nr:MAG: SAM-dependent methyltransferase [Chitinophagaceae bacterium]
MERKLLLTGDGSHTILVPDLDITYHSRHGALQESVHVFIEAGLNYVMKGKTTPCAIFELGFGTGLNALLTCMEAHDHNREINYTAIEPFPLERELVNQLNYAALLQRDDAALYESLIHDASWNGRTKIHEHFTLTKYDHTLEQMPVNGSYDLVYFDAFSPTSQPALWAQDSFEKIFAILRPGGVLTTYCSRSIVRRTMTAVGFKVEKIPGPWGKREMVRAHKPYTTG